MYAGGADGPIAINRELSSSAGARAVLEVFRANNYTAEIANVKIPSADAAESWTEVAPGPSWRCSGGATCLTLLSHYYSIA